MCLAHAIWFFYIYILHTCVIFLLAILENRLPSGKDLSRQLFGKKLKIWRLNPLFTLSFFFVSLRNHRSDFRNISEVKGIFYCIIFTLRNSGSYLHTFKLLFFLTVKKFSKLFGYWHILAIKRITICLHGWVILKFFGKKWKLASGCPRSTMNLSFDVVVFSSSISER